MRISVINPKGGVGKTSIAFSLAKDLGLDFVTNDFSIIPQIYEKAKIETKPQLYQNTIYDFGGFFEAGLLKIIEKSDYIVIPTINDYNSLAKTIQALKEIENKNIIIIANVLENDKDFTQIKNSLKQFSNCIILPLKKSKIFKNSIESGLSATELYNENKLSKYTYKTVFKQYNTIIKHLKVVNG